MKLRHRFVAALIVGASGLAGTACDSPPRVDDPVDYPWQEVVLPAVGPGEHPSVRAATGCRGRWYLTGAIIGADGTPRPAAWASTDGTVWKSMRLEPNTYYGRLNTLYAAACRFGSLAALGAKTGGAHGFPRTSNWYQQPDGVMRQIEPPYTVYGGPEGVDVSRLAAGPSAWMETGNRVSGAAVWVSPDAESFRIVENVRGLANDSASKNWADDVISTPSGWTVVGSVTQTGHVDSDPAVWESADGAVWRRLPVPATNTYEEMQRATTVDGGVVGIGVQGDRFGAWRGDESGWREVGTFGTSGGPGLGSAVTLTATVGHLIAVTMDGSVHAMWQSTDGGSTWQRLAIPAPAPAAVDKATTAFALDGRVLLAVDDGATTRVWVAALTDSN